MTTTTRAAFAACLFTIDRDEARRRLEAFGQAARSRTTILITAPGSSLGTTLREYRC